MHVVRSNRVCRNYSRQRGVDASRQSQVNLVEAILEDVVAGAHHQRGIDLGGSILPLLGFLYDRRSTVGVFECAAHVNRIERLVSLFADLFLTAPGVVKPFSEDPFGVDIRDHQVLLEGPPPRDDVAALVYDQAVAVEYQFVLTADEVAVGQRNGVVLRSRTQHPFAVETLARVIRRGGYVDDQLRVPNQRLEPGRPARIPDVFTDVHTQA